RGDREEHPPTRGVADGRPVRCAGGRLGLSWPRLSRVWWVCPLHGSAAKPGHRHCGFFAQKEFDMPDSTTPSDGEEGVRRRFDLVAEGYDRPSLRAFRTGAERLVELAALRSGQVVLDVASGTGHAAVAAARSVGPQGRVVAVDASAEMCERARQKV